MEDNTKANGSQTICMERGFTLGKMAEGMKDNINQTKNMDTEPMYGLMEGDMKVIGLMVSSMDKENTFYQMER